MLDFDLPKECSVTLTRENVYICLVCGGSYSGRGKETPAYTHSVQASHHVFIKIATEKFYCLPGTQRYGAARMGAWAHAHTFLVDNYEIVDSALDDIKRAMNPRFSMSEIARLDSNSVLSRDRMGIAYLPGASCRACGRVAGARVPMGTPAQGSWG